MTVTQAVCLVGGRGTRLGALTDSMPKPLLPVGGRPFLDYLVHEARRFGLGAPVAALRLPIGQIGKRYDGQKFGSLSVDVVVEASPAGTAGALANAAPPSRRDVLPAQRQFILRFQLASPGDRPAPKRLDHPCHPGQGHSGHALRQDRSRRQPDRGFRPEGGSSEPINAGIYLVRRKILGKIKASPCSLEREILPELAEARRAYRHRR